MTSGVLAVIPARMESERFPGKPLVDICGRPMIEHVYRRTLESQVFDDIIIATPNQEILDVANSFGAHARLTSRHHENGSSRAAEVSSVLNPTHVVVVQGDEPLIDPKHLTILVQSMKTDSSAHAWNLTAPLTDTQALDSPNVVKCTCSPTNRILFMFRKDPYRSASESHLHFTRKVMGVIAYEAEALQRISASPPTPLERQESIEQLRIMELDLALRSIPVFPDYPSVNTLGDLRAVRNQMQGGSSS